MGNLNGNYAMKHLRGKVGDLLVYKQFYGDTIVCKIPKKPTTASFQQKANRNKFRDAIGYARYQTHKPEVKALYRTGMTRKKRNPFLVAVSDYMHAPSITMINTSAYSGAIGSEIIITATDDFKVKEVIVELRSAADEVIEKGSAVLSTDTSDRWIYRATVAQVVIAGSKVLVTATDLAWNSTKEVVTI